MDRGQSEILPFGSVLHGPQDQIFVRRAGKFRAAGHSAAASDRASAHARLHGGPHREIELQSQPETIETRAKIRGGGRNANLECWTLGISHGKQAIYRRRSRLLRMAFLLAAIFSGALRNAPVIRSGLGAPLCSVNSRESVPR